MKFGKWKDELSKMKVWDIFETKKYIVECVEQHSCKGCHFLGNLSCGADCHSTKTIDKKSHIFKVIDK